MADTKRDLEKRLEDAEAEVSGADLPDAPAQPWMRPLPRKLWDSPAAAWVWDLTDPEERDVDEVLREVNDE